MLNITIKVIPAYNPTLEHNIYNIDIWNDLTGTLCSGNYKYKGKNEETGEVLTGNIKEFSRSSKGGAIKLVSEVINDILNQKNIKY